MYTLKEQDNSFSIAVGSVEILRYSRDFPCLFLGRGKDTIQMFRGNFKIEDRLEERIALKLKAVLQDENRFRLVFSCPGMQEEYILAGQEQNGILKIEGSGGDGEFNRLWLRIPAEAEEHVTGGGEQFSALDLRGKIWPIWTREQGVGRNKLTEITRLADASDGGGGDYHTTFFPQPTFVSSRMYFSHLENYEYSELDFRDSSYHEICLWGTQFRMDFGTGKNYPEILEGMTSLLGRQPSLPDWAMKGIWLGVQGGTDRAVRLERRCREAGVNVSAVWIQDWEGKRITSFGKRLQWDWRWNKEMYPELDRIIREDSDTAWMGYINPYLVEGGVLYREAKEKGFFVCREDGSDYLFDFGEFNCGVVDLTSPEAFSWYKNVIKTNLIGIGFRGWMADFGEYLPADAVCRGGMGSALHNKWPALWAKCNREAVEEAGMLGKCVFFMRSGAAGSQDNATLIWAGDQCVDWSEDDGLPSVITAALSLGMSGFGLHTCDAGGYTTLFHLKRDEELLLRWLEFACFTPVMRTHEGNRPDVNIQLYDSETVLKATARLTEIHDRLLPYLKLCCEQNEQSGLPVMRPLFFRAPEERNAYSHRLYSYLLGDDVLVAPVVEPGAKKRKMWLPSGQWENLWSGESSVGGWVTVPSPMGKPPVFFNPESPFAGLFRGLKYV